MKSKPSGSAQQLVAMRFLARSFPVAWIPCELDSFSPAHPELVTATKTVPAIRALYRKGWAVPVPKLGKWACAMTVAGMAAFEALTDQAGLVDKAKATWLREAAGMGFSDDAALQQWLVMPGVRA